MTRVTLPMTFWVRQLGRGSTMYLARSTPEPDMYRIHERSHPDGPAKGKLRITPDGSVKRDGNGYMASVSMGTSRRAGEAFWKPSRPINTARHTPSEAVSVRQTTLAHDGAAVVEILFSHDMEFSHVTSQILRAPLARQLMAQLHAIFYPPPPDR